MGIFKDRSDAGRQLAAVLAGRSDRLSMVLAIPRGGVVVGAEVARALGLALDVIIPRKIGAPGDSELAIGAVTEDGTVALDERLVSDLHVPAAYIEEEAGRQRLEVERRLRAYRGSRPYPAIKGRSVALVDDGLATGATMKAAVASVRRRGARSVLVAVPVGPPSTVAELRALADDVVCLQEPPYFQAVGQFYREFRQTTDDEVRELLGAGRKAGGHGKAPVSG